LTTRSFELTRLDTATFEHLVNSLATKVLGAGLTGFAPGSDGGRDGYFEGEAKYPSEIDRWNGVWYIQSKFHAPSLSTNSQKWLQNQIRDEIKEFQKSDSRRKLPKNWIIATNIDPSGTPSTGTFDVVREMVKSLDPELAQRTHIWGGKKILDLLVSHDEIANHYGGLITSGDVLAKMMCSLSDVSANIETVLRHLIVDQLVEQQHTKLEQAGSSSDTRPGLQALFTDLPYKFDEVRSPKILLDLSRNVAENHTPSANGMTGVEWQQWRRHTSRSRVCFIRGGPGNGKSTVTQFLCQIQRAALLSKSEVMAVPPRISELAQYIKKCAESAGYWPISPRIPIYIELRLFAHWYSEQPSSSARGVLTYLADRLSKDIEQEVLVGTMKRAFSSQRWLFIFDGLDEVPTDVKDELAFEIIKFSDGTLFECLTDALIVCTSRPQGYSGQFDELKPSIIDLDKLTPEEALACADPILKIDRNNEDVKLYRTTLNEAIASQSIREIMTTPLQTHIMAVVVRDGGRPPERRWQLFLNFFQVIKKREANRNLVDPKISRLLREGDKLIKSLHNRLGFELHYRAERSSGAQTSLTRSELRAIISQTVHSLQDDDTEETIATLDEATRERLVLVNTPESGETVRFDIRPLQEFFAAEYIYESAIEDSFLDRLRSIAPDPHWREVMHFLLSALVEQERRVELAQAVNVLSELDDGSVNLGRALSRRLSIGGIIVVRLLREGVLESDKRTRENFRKCLPPFLASTDARSQLGHTPPPHSARWLASVALDTIEESHFSESIGALCILPLVIGDGTKQSDQARQYIENCSNDSLAVVLDSLPSRYLGGRDKDICEPTWLIAALLHRLIADDWMSVDAHTLAKIYEVLGDNTHRLRRAGEICGVCPLVSEYLMVFFNGNLDFEFETDFEDDIEGQLIGGLIRKVKASPKSELSDIMSNDDFWQKYDEVSGVLRACMLLKIAATQPTEYNISLLKKEIGSCTNISLLPSQFASMFVRQTKDVTDEVSLESLLSTTESAMSHSFHIDEFDTEKIDWSEVFKVLPFSAPHFLSEFYSKRTSDNLAKWFKDPRNSAAYLRIIQLAPERAKMSFGALGQILNHCSAHAEEFKNFVACSLPDRSEVYFHGNEPPFKFEFPDDNLLLPHLLVHLTSNIDRELGQAKLSDSTIYTRLREYVPDISKLDTEWAENTHGKAIRIASGCLLLLADLENEIGDKQCEYYDELLNLFDPEYSHWFLPAVFKIISPAIERRDNTAVKFANDLLARIRTDLQARMACTSTISRWREASHAPVHETQSSNIWATE